MEDGTHVPSNSNKKKALTLRLATWNVRTMTPGISDDLTKISDSRKTAIINNELLRLNIDIAALQETRLPDLQKLAEKDYTFFWQGKGFDEHRQHGVGFAVRNSLLQMIETPSKGTERILKLKLNTTQGSVHLISTYAPTNTSSDEVKDAYYEALNDLVTQIPTQDQIVILGDLNARVGNDSDSWPTSLGKHGIGNINENGQRILEFCTLHNMCVTNTLFPLKPHLKTSWMHPRSKRWHQLDPIIVKKEHSRNVKKTRVYHSADCDTDHSLVGCQIKITPKKLYRTKPPCKPRIDGARTKESQSATLFNENLSTALTTANSHSNSATDKWTQLKETMHEEAMKVFGRKKKKSEDWYLANADKMEPLIEVKRLALSAHKRRPSRQTKKALRDATLKAKKAAKECANSYFLDLAGNIQMAADTGNIRGVYEGIKKATGPTPSKAAPLKELDGSVITDKSQQMSRWVGHYTELYHRETIVTETALNSIDTSPCMYELDELPTVEELSKAIDSLPDGKAPGMDGIPAEIYRCSKDTILPRLHELLCECWTKGEVPQDMRDANIVTIYKNKGDKSDCNNYRGISLLSIAGKVFAKVALKRLQQLGETVYPESQCGFRPNRSTTDMIFSVRQIQEKCREQNQPLYMVFIDLTKAFDLVSRKGLFQVLSKTGCPPQLLSIIKSFHTDMKGVIQFDGDYSEPFSIHSGVKQGCVLAPTLFGIFFSMMLKYAFSSGSEGIFLHTRYDGGIFNLQKLKALTKVRKTLIRDMLFADDAAIVAHTESDLQTLMDKFSRASKEFGLTVSIKKTNVLVQGIDVEPKIVVDDQILEVVHNFTYLGSTISDDLSLGSEINKRIGKACATFSKLKERVWKNSKLVTATKMAIYNACVLSTLLYGSETWPTYASQEKKLNSFHLKNLRHIMNIRWDDYVTNEEVLERTGMHSVYALLQQRRLRWLGHVSRMPDKRIPKDLLYGELQLGARNQGRPIQRYKDVAKRDMTNCNIDPQQWEVAASDRSCWKQTVKEGLHISEDKRKERAKETRQRRKQKQKDRDTNTDQTGSVKYTCSTCGRECKSRIGLFSHNRKCSTTS